MNKKSDNKKLKTKNTLTWYLTVGHHYGTINKNDAFKICRVDRITFYRWLTGKASAPEATLELLRLHAFGEPPSNRSQAWRGFRFQNDKLITEDGRLLSPADLKAVFFWKQLAFDNLDMNGRKELYKELKEIYKQA